jgi:hypothetical protein
MGTIYNFKRPVTDDDDLTELLQRSIEIAKEKRMAKRISDVERITAYFGAADAVEAETMFKVIRGIMTSRSLDTGQRKSVGKSTGAKKRAARNADKGSSPKATPSESDRNTQAKAVSAGGVASDDEKAKAAGE